MKMGHKHPIPPISSILVFWDKVEVGVIVSILPLADSCPAPAVVVRWRTGECT